MERKVKHIKSYFYFSLPIPEEMLEGALSQEMFFDKDGKTIRNIAYGKENVTSFYDSEGFNCRRVTSEPGGEWMDERIEYDGQGNNLHSTIKYSDGTSASEWWDWALDGRSCRRTFSWNGQQKYTDESYGASQQLLRSTEYGFDGQWKRIEDYSYREDGTKSSVIVQENGEPTYAWDYDENGNFVSFYKDGKQLCTIDNTYDDEGCLVRSICRDTEGEIQYVNVRVIEFWD